ncbi:hypothetical protein [Hyphomicrobium sp.]|uniref:hypothetical protein n=1 Tax=Hyphomicrobium sp. TaxID=82 RepID=UPI001D41D226|nr:hypothetical protein [Hyphomicrobium sp.]MBY0558934.1 hypothetical protein [Hyphomicrobium sp.]
MKKHLAIALLLYVVAGFASARADGVTFEEDNSTGLITLRADKVSLMEILRAIQDKYGVELQGVADMPEGDLIAGHFSGRLPQILHRLLRNHNYAMIRSPANSTGVGRILLSGASRAAPATPATPAQPDFVP